VRRSWWRSDPDRAFEAALRRERPEPGEDFLDALVERVQEDSRRVRSRNARVGFAAALTAAGLGALASVGGLSYAATATHVAVSAVKKVVAPKKQAKPAIRLLGLRAADDQYRPGFGWGDTHHVHTGPPGLRRGVYDAADNGSFAPPPSTAPTLAGVTGDGIGYYVKTELALDEQADIVIGVVGADGKSITLIQRRGTKPGSYVAGPLTGPDAASSVKYRVLIPRSVPIVLRIPAKAVKRGATYNIKVVATSPLGQSSTIEIPFSIPA
jgi:hypothetical protein